MNELGSGKFRTSADNEQEQTCYFNRNKSDSHFTSYTSKRVQPEKLLVSIVKVNSDFNLVNESLEIEFKNSFINDSTKRKHQQINRGDFNNGRTTETFISTDQILAPRTVGSEASDPTTSE